MADLHVPGLRAQLQAHLGSLHLAAQFDVPHGTLVVLGPNGAGKSSLLRCLLGAVAVQRAQIQVQGRWLHHTQLGIELPLEQRGLGYVPQSYALFAHLSVSQHLHFALQCAGVRSRLARDQRVERFLIELNLTHLGQQRPAQLSGGERQRVALARALCSQPSALLLDEPLAALDVEQRAHVRSFLADYLRQLQLPCVLVTHDPEDAIALSTGGCLVLEDGQVTQRGTWNDLALTPASAFVTRFVSALAQTDA